MVTHFKTEQENINIQIQEDCHSLPRGMEACKTTIKDTDESNDFDITSQSSWVNPEEQD